MSLRLRLLAALLSATLLWVCFWPSAGSQISGELVRRWLMWAAAALAVTTLLPRCDEQPALGWSPLIRTLVGAYALALALSTALALHPIYAIFGGNERGLGLLSELASWVLVYAGFRLATSSVALIGQLRWIAGIALALSAWALVDYLSVAGWGFRSSAALGNPLFLASLLATSLPLHLSRAVWPSDRACWAALTLQSLALLSTGGRAAILAALAGLLLYGALRQRRRYPLIVASALCIGMLATAALHWRPASVAIRAELYTAALTASTGSESLRAIDGANDPAARWRPLLGYGPDSIEPALTRYRSAALNSDWHERAGWDRWADRAHSRLLDRLLETGWIGLVLTLLLTCVLARRLRPLLDPAAADPSAVIAAGVLIWLGDGLLGVPSAAADLVAALFVGYGLALARPQSQAPASALPAAPRWQSLSLGVGSGVALGLIVLSIAVARGQWATSALRGQTVQNSSTALALHWQPYSALPAILASDALMRDRQTLDAAQIKQLQTWTLHAVTAAPSVPRAWLLHGNASLLAGDDEAAVQSWTRGLSLINRQVAVETDPELLLQTAVALTRSAERLEQNGHSDGANAAYASARSALETPSKPNSAAWWATLAWLRARDGEIDAAIAAYQQALAINPNDAASVRNLQRLQSAQ